jgi:hypothetical protein
MPSVRKAVDIRGFCEGIAPAYPFAALVAHVATKTPMNGMIELAGPERISLDEIVRRYLQAKRDLRSVAADVHARYFGAEINDKSLTPGDNPQIGATSFETWVNRSVAH